MHQGSPASGSSSNPGTPQLRTPRIDIPPSPFIEATASGSASSSSSGAASGESYEYLAMVSAIKSDESSTDSESESRPGIEAMARYIQNVFQQTGVRLIDELKVDEFCELVNIDSIYDVMGSIYSHLLISSSNRIISTAAPEALSYLERAVLDFGDYSKIGDPITHEEYLAQIHHPTFLRSTFEEAFSSYIQFMSAFPMSTMRERGGRIAFLIDHTRVGATSFNEEKESVKKTLFAQHVFSLPTELLLLENPRDGRRKDQELSRLIPRLRKRVEALRTEHHEKLASCHRMKERLDAMQESSDPALTARRVQLSINLSRSAFEYMQAYWQYLVHNKILHITEGYQRPLFRERTPRLDSSDTTLKQLGAPLTLTEVSERITHGTEILTAQKVEGFLDHARVSSSKGTIRDFTGEQRLAWTSPKSGWRNMYLTREPNPHHLIGEPKFEEALRNLRMQLPELLDPIFTKLPTISESICQSKSKAQSWINRCKSRFSAQLQAAKRHERLFTANIERMSEHSMLYTEYQANRNRLIRNWVIDALLERKDFDNEAQKEDARKTFKARGTIELLRLVIPELEGYSDLAIDRKLGVLIKEGLSARAFYHEARKQTFLHQAARCNLPEVVTHLLRAGADPQALNQREKTPVHEYVQHGMTQTPYPEGRERLSLNAVFRDIERISLNGELIEAYNALIIGIDGVLANYPGKIHQREKSMLRRLVTMFKNEEPDFDLRASDFAGFCSATLLPEIKEHNTAAVMTILNTIQSVEQTLLRSNLSMFNFSSLLRGVKGELEHYRKKTSHPERALYQPCRYGSSAAFIRTKKEEAVFLDERHERHMRELSKAREEHSKERRMVDNTSHKAKQVSLERTDASEDQQISQQSMVSELQQQISDKDQEIERMRINQERMQSQLAILLSIAEERGQLPTERMQAILALKEGTGSASGEAAAASSATAFSSREKDAQAGEFTAEDIRPQAKL